MKRLLFYLGMGSCLSSGDQRSATVKCSDAPAITPGTVQTVQTPVSKTRGTSKEEVFFDSQPWLDSDDEDFMSVNGDMSPVRQVDNRDHQGRRLSDLFRESSFSSDSKTSLEANTQATGKDEKLVATKLESRKSSQRQRFLPSLVRSLSCGDRKKRPSPVHIAVVG